MDSTPSPNPEPHPANSSASKLPIKRKNPEYSSFPNIATGDGGGCGNRTSPPFKFHRIWTESDEIRFLQGLLGSSCKDLFFPRDLNLFYSKFSETTSHPYTKSQLSEKLRRLRKKFRVVSSRLARGLDKAMLSPHDRALFDLSKRLWHPDFSLTSPFFASVKQNKSNLVGVRVSFSPTLDMNNHGVLNRIGDNDGDDDHDYDFEDDHVIVGDSYVENDGVNVKLSEGNVELDKAVGQEQKLSMPSGSGGGGRGGLGGGLGEVVAKTVLNVFNQSLKEVRTAVIRDRGSDQRLDDFEKRWRDQRVTELDVLARRLRWNGTKG